MSGTLKERLVELLEEQAVFGALPLPADLDIGLLRDPERLRQARECRREELACPPQAGLAGTVAGLRREALAPPQPVAPAPSAPELTAQWASLEEARAAAAACARCAIAERRTNSVFGVGSAEADLVVVGEAPGEQEDLQGEPFVGRAGQLLDKMLAAIGFARGDIYICNTLKCRPTGNRNPLPDELENCRPFLDHQLHLLRPRLILALGLVSSHALLGGTASLSALRAREHQYRGIPLRVTYHPAALLRNVHWKKPAWEDLKALRVRYEELGGRSGTLPGRV
jgi:DNA polymerase